jgi:hypothetical protein
MRLSEWRARSRVRDALGPKVMAVVTPVLGVVEVEEDPHAWVQWGDDPATKYSLLVPIPAGLVVVAVRANIAGSGPRATAKIVRWSRLQMGELAVETEGTHRMVSFQVESFVLRGADENADAIGRFALVLLAAVEGRPWPPFDKTARRGTIKHGLAAKGSVLKRAKPAASAAVGPAARNGPPTKAPSDSTRSPARPAAARPAAARPAAARQDPGLPALPAGGASGPGRRGSSA